MIARRTLMLLGVATAVPSCAPAPAVPQRSAATNKEARGYFDMVVAHVNRFRKYPLVAALQYREGRVVVIVHIARDGRVLEVEVRQSSGQAMIDDAETDAIWRASPLPQPPAELLGDPVTLIMPTTYKVPP